MDKTATKMFCTKSLVRSDFDCEESVVGKITEHQLNMSCL
ncbi:UNVERIFIED_ORG: hypothetical protein J2806_004012 [Kosakonia oryzae]|uniref:Uncharacterized protein n=1 Tax=Kosakonia radicincitans TaxID=283686 RepID=A0AAX2EY86_9ENTR|nr:hypothetical protein [Kosakonia oryzae]SFF26030.1 hypothetical protein SAMN03159468_04377 [Kosakonia radicincitans]SFR25172.1 hypothetical protein SAMN03159514_04567 [Kosakonia radicincitans]SFU06629.1 hypothetical protein SAMN03159428_03840 [Kosakonia radicincitans]SFY06015.1 hypothetical protein SAMN03159436_03613 [Kosakonia radicincitans]